MNHSGCGRRIINARSKGVSRRIENQKVLIIYISIDQVYKARQFKLHDLLPPEGKAVNPPTDFLSTPNPVRRLRP